MEKRGFEYYYDKVLSFLSGLGSIWIFVLMIIIMIDVGSRVFLNIGFKGTPEIVSNSIVAIAFLQIAYVLSIDGHIRSTVFYDKFPLKVRQFLDILACLFGIALFALMMYSSWNLFVTAVQVNEFEGEGALRVPTSPTRFIILLGSFLMIIKYVFILAKNIKAFNAKAGKEQKWIQY